MAGPACSVSVVSSPSDAQQPIRMLFWLSFANARRRLWIATPTSSPTPSSGRRSWTAPATAWTSASSCPETTPTPYRSSTPAGRYYEELLEAGVRIFEYQPSMMHAKTVVVDDAWAVVGSANMDERSMEINEENMLGIAEPELARAAAEGMEKDFARSREIELEAWRRRPLYQRGLEKAAMS